MGRAATDRRLPSVPSVERSFALVLLATHSAEDSGAWDLQRVLDERLLSHPRVALVELRAITALNMGKALRAAVKSAMGLRR